MWTLQPARHNRGLADNYLSVITNAIDRLQKSIVQLEICAVPHTAILRVSQWITRNRPLALLAKAGLVIFIGSSSRANWFHDNSGGGGAL